MTHESLSERCVDAWRRALTQSFGDGASSPVRHLVILPKCDSTQDECRRIANGQPGVLVTTLQQTHGRGRLGRSWADDQGAGVALTMSAPSLPPERLAVAAAVGVCEAVEQFAARRLGIRWPNDVMADSRKLAGILIEQSGDIALIGVGVNVNQTTWPSDLAGIAISLAQLVGAPIERPAVTAAVVARLCAALDRSEDELCQAFQPRDVLLGTRQQFISAGAPITGVVESVEPTRGLRIRTSDGPRFLPAQTTSLAHGG